MKRITAILWSTLVTLFLAVPAVYCEETQTTATAPEEKIESAMAQLGISFSGLVEAQLYYQDTDADDTSDIVLSTLELGIEANPLEHVYGQVVFVYEEDDTDPIDVDQAFIRLDGEDKYPLSLEMGRLYVPFGGFETHFISDPLTQQLGETRESALVAAYSGSSLEIFGGVFNGDVNEADENDDMIDGFTAGTTFTLSGNGALAFSAGLSYISNIGDSDGLTEELTTTDTVSEYVPGLAAHLLVGLDEQFFGKFEYITALDSFTEGDLSFDDGQSVEPWALNLELAYAVTETFEAALRYGASDDAGTFLPESLYGVVANYAPMENVTVSLEFQYSEYVDDSDDTTATVQLGLTF